jgi:hypothetical protein
MNWSLEEIEKKIYEYKVKITAKDIFKARQRLVEKFEKSVRGVTEYEAWIFSPYFIFLEMPINRAVIRLPNGVEIEDLMFERFRAFLSTQNIIISRLIELEAKDKQLENYLKQMLGEMGVSSEGKAVEIEELMKEELGEKVEKKEEKKKENPFKKIFEPINNFFKFFGLNLMFFRARVPYHVPYEFAIRERVTKYYLREVGGAFGMVVSFIKSAFGVP